MGARRFLPVLAMLSALAMPASYAQDIAPDALIRGVTLEVIDAIRANPDVRAGNPAMVAELVEQRILPHFDFTHMTQLAVARNWLVATPEQRIVLTAEFRTLLVRTYSTALAGYRDQTFEFKPLRAARGDTDVTVRSVIRQAGTAPLNLDYDLEKQAAGWKVYDIKIAGMSLITTYRDSFATTVRESGVNGLIHALADKNRLGDGRFRSRRSGDFFTPVLFQGLLQPPEPGPGYISHSR
jgi:phospholipid transport system substrate-binding protein